MRKTTTMAGAVSLLLLALSGTTVADHNEWWVAGKTGGCSHTDDDPWFGGTKTSCKLPCEAYAELKVKVVAQDTHASTSGDYNCGGQTASCTVATSTCAGVSEGLTRFAQDDDDAICEGRSDEFWSSEVTVVCTWIVILPDSDLISTICDFGSMPPHCHPPVCFDELLEQGVPVEEAAAIQADLVPVAGTTGGTIAFKMRPDGSGFSAVSAWEHSAADCDVETW